MNFILLILGRLYNINISSYTKAIQIVQYYYAINVSPSPASHFSTSQFTRTSHKHLALYLAVYHLAFSHFAVYTRPIYSYNAKHKLAPTIALTTRQTMQASIVVFTRGIPTSVPTHFGPCPLRYLRQIKHPLRS